jgi:hypothetical protein
MSGVLLLSLLAAVASSADVYEKIKGSIFTVEVLSTGSDAKQVLGSGYLVTHDGRLVTNYHVVSSYVDDPARYSIRVRNHFGTLTAKLLSFDLVNDLAILRIAETPAAPLILARREPPRGSPVVALGNPEGLGLSLIEGVFNGYAEKGFVERLLLSMPLNAGMSGGPILDSKGRVIGTNVAIVWMANSLSFGVPVARIPPLLDATALAVDRESLRRETLRQLLALERRTRESAIAPFLSASEDDTVGVGELKMTRPPDIFECWSRLQVHKDEGVTNNQYSCNLQFTPTAGDVGPVGNSYGFYSALSKTAQRHHDVSPVDPSGGVLSAPECLYDRVKTQTLTFHVGTCVNALVRYPGLFQFDLIATSVSRSRQGACVALRGRGLSLESFSTLTRGVLESVRLDGQP